MTSRSSSIGGVHGQVLRVDLSEDTSGGWSEPLAPEVFAEVIGGIGLASLLLLRLCPPGADPLGPENPLIFATSPFAGTGITTSSKIAVAARSPQTGMIGDSLSSSYLALELKRTGHDALAITGCAPEWSVLVVEDGRCRLQSAHELMGLSPSETADRLRAARSRASAATRRGSAARGSRLPRTAIAFSRFAPITAPAPVRPARRPSLAIAA